MPKLQLIIVLIVFSLIFFGCKGPEGSSVTSGDESIGFQEVYIVGSAVKKKCIQYECEKEISKGKPAGSSSLSRWTERR